MSDMICRRSDCPHAGLGIEHFEHRTCAMTPPNEFNAVSIAFYALRLEVGSALLRLFAKIAQLALLAIGRPRR